jgi:hypothetical protein
MCDDDTYDPPDDYTIEYEHLVPPGDDTMHNIDAWIEYELTKYMLNHAREYNLSQDDVQTFKQHVLNFVRRRRRCIDTNDEYRFLVHVAGTTGARVNSLIGNRDRSDDSIERLLLDPEKLETERQKVRAAITKHAEMVAKNQTTALNADILVAMLEDLEISGVLRFTPEVVQARDKVLVDLSLKRGGDEVTKGRDMGFREIVRGTKTRVKLAELVGYQMLLFDQLAPRRAFKTADYGRISAKHDAAWVALMVLLGISATRSHRCNDRLGHRLGHRLDRTPGASNFLSAGAIFRTPDASWTTGPRLSSW